MYSENDMHTHSQVALQVGAEISATAKTEKNNRDTTGAARRGILAADGDGVGKCRLTE